MNTTEAMAVCLAMALAYGEEKGVTRQQRQALLKWGKKVRTAQAKLDRTRKARMLSQLAGVSAEDMNA